MGRKLSRNFGTNYETLRGRQRERISAVVCFSIEKDDGERKTPGLTRENFSDVPFSVDGSGGGFCGSLSMGLFTRRGFWEVTIKGIDKKKKDQGSRFN
jgi:hypothetical protein